MRFDLVFEGGGAKGIAFVGALQAFAAAGHNHSRLIGTSAGAVMATFLAAGYSATEMETALTEQAMLFPSFLETPGPFSQQEVDQSTYRRWLKLFDIPFLVESLEERLDDMLLQQLLKSSQFRHLFSLTELGGWYAAENFMEWLRRNLDNGIFRGAPRRFSKMTLAEFFEVTRVHVTLIAADTSGHNLLVLNHNTAPELPLVWAVRMSMSVPLLWQEVIWQPAWGMYQNANMAYRQIVDGGLLSNFPIELFISDLPHVTALMGPKGEDPILGLLIDESQIVSGQPPTPSPQSAASDTFPALRRLRQLVDTSTQAHDKMVLDAFEHLVARLPAAGYGTTEFDMSADRRQALIDAGRSAMHNYFTGRDLAQADATQGPAPESGSQARAWADEVADRLLSRAKPA